MKAMTPCRRRFSGFSGIELVADSYGSEENPTVLLLPHRGHTRHVWDAVAQSLAQAGRHVLAIDLRGHGDSERPPDGRYDLDALINDLRAVLEQLTSRPVIVGASLGGWIATAAIGEASAPLASALVLVDAPPRIDWEAAREQAEMMRQQVQTDSGAALLDPRILDEPDPVGVEERLLKAAAQLTLPTLIIRGELSRTSPAEAIGQLARLIPGAEAIEVANAGADVATERTDAFNALLLDFLERKAPLKSPEYVAGSEPRTLRDALGCFATGVTVVTALGQDGKPVGLTANSFTSVSLDPPLLLVCLARSSGSLPVFEAAHAFAVNVLHIGQQPVSGRFASRGEDRFASTAWEQWSTGVPIIMGSLASFECERHAMFDGGDHVILVGRVIRVRFEPRRDPLLFFRGKYRRLHFS